MTTTTSGELRRYMSERAMGFGTTTAGALGLAEFETWDCCHHHKYSVRPITARRNLYVYPAHMPWDLSWHGWPVSAVVSCGIPATVALNPNTSPG